MILSTSLRNYKTYPSLWESDINIVNHYKPRRLVSLGVTCTISFVLVFGSVLLSPSVVKVALANDMVDAPMTKDTITAGSDGDDDVDGDDDDDQPDNLPNPEDAPVTTETITSGNNDGSEEDEGNEQNNNEVGGTNLENESKGAVSPVANCPAGQEKGLFSQCVPINIPINRCNNELGTSTLLNPTASNVCLNK